MNTPTNRNVFLRFIANPVFLAGALAGLVLALLPIKFYFVALCIGLPVWAMSRPKK